jgi:hypothetical protein
MKKSMVQKQPKPKVVETTKETSVGEELPLERPSEMTMDQAMDLVKETENRDIVSAIDVVNKARVLDLYNKAHIIRLFQNLSNFYKEFEQEFSKSDLETLLEPVNRLVDFYKVKGLWDSPPVRVGRDLVTRINGKLPNAQVATETKATFRVEQIAASLSHNVSPEEVKADVARILAPVVREMIAAGKTKSKTKKKRGRPWKSMPKK